MTSVNPRVVLSRLRCPDCLHEGMESSGPACGETEQFSCPKCGRALVLQDGILRALPHSVRSSTEQNVRFYDEMAGIESPHLDQRAHTRNHRAKWKAIVKGLSLDAERVSRTVLELGTGAGAHGAQVAAGGHAYVGVDASAAYLHRAAQNYPSLASMLLVEAEASRIPFVDGSFDGVFCVGTLHHLEEPLEGVRELYRVLSPGGRFCFVEPVRFHPAHFIGYLQNPRVECGTLKTSARRIACWLREQGVGRVEISRTVFTPNKPAALSHVFDVLDSVCVRYRALQWLSVMFCVYGQK